MEPTCLRTRTLLCRLCKSQMLPDQIFPKSQSRHLGLHTTRSTQMSTTSFTGRSHSSSRNFSKDYCDLTNKRMESEKSPMKVDVSKDKVLQDKLLRHLEKDDFDGIADIFGPAVEPVNVSPEIMQAFGVAPFVKKSKTLQILVKVGVDLWKVEKQHGVVEFLMKLDFEKDVAPCIRFLRDVGVPSDDIGRFLTLNPGILRENPHSLQGRINYFENKKFAKDAVAKIICTCPKILSLTTIQIDAQLGFYQRTFSLSGDEVRSVITKCPRLVTWPADKIKKRRFTVSEEFGFSEREATQLLLMTPKLWLRDGQRLRNKFHTLHNVMGISHEQLLQWPPVFYCRQHIVERRHAFLKEMGRAQYDPKLENYVSLKALVIGTDKEFCENVVHVPLQVFEDFMKTL